VRACLDAYGWERDAANWPQVMLTFTLLHDFNVLRPDIHLDRFVTLDELANTIWGLS
jgi:hypothetical protein